MADMGSILKNCRVQQLALVFIVGHLLIFGDSLSLCPMSNSRILDGYMCMYIYIYIKTYVCIIIQEYNAQHFIF